MSTDFQRLCDALNPAGWPRPRLPYKDSTIPAPWIARLAWNGKEIEPASVYFDRADPVFRDWLCQVCGCPCSEVEAFAPLTIEDHYGDGELPWGLPGEGWNISGGPVCSSRCCELAIAVCPNFRNQVTVIKFARADGHEWSPDTLRALLVTKWTRVDRVERVEESQEEAK